MWGKKALSFHRDRTSSTAAARLSTKKSLSLNIEQDGNNSYGSVDGKRRRKGGCFSFKEVSIEPDTASSLKDVDSSKLQAEIRRWAKAVVAYARQVSGRFGIAKSSSSSRTRSGSDSLR